MRKSILFLYSQMMEGHGKLRQGVGKKRNNKEPNSIVICVASVFEPRIVFTFDPLACSETHFSPHLFPGKTFALLWSWSWGIQFMTKPSPLLTAAARVPAWRRTQRLQAFPTMAGARAVPPPHLPWAGLWLGPSITLQPSWSGWWGRWTPWSPCSSPSITACCSTPHPSTGWKPSK